MKLQPSLVKLKTYTGQGIQVLGQHTVQVGYEGAQHSLPLVVGGGDRPTLFGRNWLEVIQLDWGSIKAAASQLETLLEQHKPVFQEGLGTVKGAPTTLQLKPGAHPHFCKARLAPYALKGAIEQELDRLEASGVIEKVKFSEWATLVVAVSKSDRSVRLCGDYKVTLNPALQVDQYLMPTPEDLYATLAGGRVFSKLDLSHLSMKPLVSMLQ